MLENIMEDSPHPQTLARTVLSCLGFAREDAFKPVAVLSGGEKAKTAMAKLLLQDLNLLVLDEPTNHLDLFTLEALEELLTGYGGTVLFVSHDEVFTQKVSTRRIRFENRKLVTEEDGAAKKEDIPAETADRGLQIMTLEMRLADLSARMSRPRKGDRPEELNAQYLQLAKELREMKRRNQ